MKKNLFLILLLGVIINIAGCWDQIELDKRAIIMAVGIDNAGEAGKITLTLQTIIPGRLTDPMHGGEKDTAVRVVSSSGMTILEAAKNFQQQTNAIPYFLHNRLLVISEELARKGVWPLMDYFIRNTQSQTRAWVLISKGKAADIINWRTEANQIPANYINDLLYCSTRQAITTFATEDIHRFMLALSSRLTSPVTSGIEIIQEQAERPPEIKVFGTAVFKEDKLVGWLSLRETKGLLWITGTSTQGILEIGYPARQQRNLVQQITRTSSKIKPELKNGKLKIKIEITEEGNIGELQGDVMLTGKNMIKLLEKRKTAEIRSEVAACLDKCQKQFHSDVFGFGEEIERHFPRRWIKIKKKWRQEFTALQVAVNAKVKIRGTGLITDPINLR